MSRQTSILIFVMIFLVLTGCSLTRTVEEVKPADNQEIQIIDEKTQQISPEFDDSMTTNTPTAQPQTQNTPTAENPKISPTSPTNPVSTNQVKGIAEANLTATGSYTSPEGPESLSVSVILKNNLVSKMSIEGFATHKVSKKYQDAFIAGIGQSFVGKSLSDITSPPIVSGSSLTPKGFDDAIAKLRLKDNA